MVVIGGTVGVARDHLAVPVNQLRRIGIVVQVHDDAPAFLEPQQRSRKLSVVQGRGDDVFGCQFDQSGGNP